MNSPDSKPQFISTNEARNHEKHPFFKKILRASSRVGLAVTALFTGSNTAAALEHTAANTPDPRVPTLPRVEHNINQNFFVEVQRERQPESNELHLTSETDPSYIITYHVYNFPANSTITVRTRSNEHSSAGTSTGEPRYLFGFDNYSTFETNSLGQAIVSESRTGYGDFILEFETQDEDGKKIVIPHGLLLSYNALGTVQKSDEFTPNEFQFAMGYSEKSRQGRPQSENNFSFVRVGENFDTYGRNSLAPERISMRLVPGEYYEIMSSGSPYFDDDGFIIRAWDGSGFIELFVNSSDVEYFNTVQNPTNIHLNQS